MIIDTDVLIWYLRGNEKAVNAIIESLPFSISIVTYMELLRGTKDKQEMRKMIKAFDAIGVNIIPIDEATSRLAAKYVEEHALSNAIGLADALIAATAMTRGLPVFTANDKHYRVIDCLQMKIFRP